MKNKKYWQDRFLQLEDAQDQLGAQCYEEVERQYRRAMQQIDTQINTWYGRLAKNNNITMQDARKILTGRELEEFKWDVNDYIRYGKENALSGEWMKQLENASARYHISRMEVIKLQMQQDLEVMFGNQLDAIDTAMRDIYINGYYHTAYEIQKGVGVGWNFATLDDRTIEKVINRPWAADGKNFSERIWQNRQKLVNELHTQLTQNIILGQDPQKAIDAIARKMNTSKISAGRLVMTEKAFFSSAAQRDCFNELGVEQYEIVATLDSHTSEICQEMDGKVFPMSQYEPGTTAPPFHVFCRSTTVPAFGDEFDDIGERAARDEDGETYHVPGDMTYPEWKKSFVDGDKSGVQKTDTRTFAQKKEMISNNERKITELYEQKKAAELKALTSHDITEMEDAAKEATNIENTIQALKRENKSIQESLGLPTNAKERFYDQTVDISKLPQSVQGREELGAIGSWTRTDYIHINDYLRNNNKGVRPESIRNAETLKNMIERNVVEEPFTVRRGTDHIAMNHLFGGDNWKDPGYNTSGKIITDKGFFATTPDPQGGFNGDIKMYIDIPKGTKGIYIGDLSVAPDEKEFLLQCGTSFEVDRIEIWYDKYNEPKYDVFMKVKGGE